MRTSQKRNKKESFKDQLKSIQAFVYTIILLSTGIIGCNAYPVSLIITKPYTEITDTIHRKGAKKVDILFVIDNSGSMEEERQKLATNLEAFIKNLASKEIDDIQIGMISTDMSKDLHKGKLLGSPRIISSKQMSREAMTSAFIANLRISMERGSDFEKPLDAMMAALSPKLLNDANANKGFLRPDAQLAVIFVTDEDDCSHDGSLPEFEVFSVACNLPRTQKIYDAKGNVELDSSGKPMHGYMETLKPVDLYIKFLKSLKRNVIVSGLIGDPYVLKKAKTLNLVDPQGGCSKDIECHVGGAKYTCQYQSPNQRKCGGCSSSKINPKTNKPVNTAIPGFRLYQLMKAFPSIKSQNWYPICGDDAGFEQALLNFADGIVGSFDSIVLTRTPYPETVVIEISFDDGSKPVQIEPAKEVGVCTSSCSGTCIQKKCYSDGWKGELNASNQYVLTLLGKAKQMVRPGSKINISYAMK